MRRFPGQHDPPAPSGAGGSLDEPRSVLSTLTRSGDAFLEFVEEHPEYRERATFTTLGELEDRVGYPVQAWPTFLRAQTMRELAALNVSLCRLVKRVPAAVFRGDPERLRDFYGLEGEHARIVASALRNPRWVRGALARSDFIDDGRKFQCVEFNVAGNIGGWHQSYWGPEYLADPAIARFFARTGIRPKCPNVLRNLLSHLLGQALRAFRSSEINLAILVPSAEEAHVGSLLGAASEEYRKILAALGTVQGRAVACRPGELYESRGRLHAGDLRVHVVVDALSGSAGVDAHRCWLRGSVLMFNGPLAPVWSDKRNLALLSELVDSDLWTPEEKVVIRRTVPWTRCVSERRIDPRAAEPVTPELLRTERGHLVLKPGSGYGGADVYLGVSTPAEEWALIVERAFADGSWIAQERLESVQRIHQDGDAGSAPFDLVWSFFVFGETFGGSLLRMAPTRHRGPVNSACGGLLGWLFEVDEDPA